VIVETLGSQVGWLTAAAEEEKRRGGRRGEREPHPEAAVSLRKIVTFVT